MEGTKVILIHLVINIGPTFFFDTINFGREKSEIISSISNRGSLKYRQGQNRDNYDEKIQDALAYLRRRLIENPNMVTYGLKNLLGSWVSK